MTGVATNRLIADAAPFGNGAGEYCSTYAFGGVLPLKSGGLGISNGAVAPQSPPSSAWGLDFALLGGNSPTYVALANNGTYTLAAGSGMIAIYDNAGIAWGYFATAFGGVTKIAGSTNAVAGAPAAGQVGMQYNGSTAYEITNKHGADLHLWISTIRFRQAS